ncbi:hypothetical protein [Nostoc sp.]
MPNLHLFILSTKVRSPQSKHYYQLIEDDSIHCLSVAMISGKINLEPK